MVRLVPGHDDGLPLPVQQPADLFRETGVCPAIGINDIDWPKPLRRALGRGHHRRADTIDRGAREKLRAAVRKLEAPDARMDTRHQSPLTACSAAIEDHP